MGKKGKSERVLPPNVRERGGKYSYRYYIPTTKIVDGIEKKSRKETESPRFDTIQEAVDFGILIAAKKIQKKLKYSEGLTVSNWSKTWLKAYIIETEPAKNTILNRQTCLNKILETFGGFLLKEVTPSLYQDFLYKLKVDGMARNSIININVTASLMFGYAKRKGLIEIDPTEDAVVPKERKTARKAGEKKQVLPKFLEKEELKLFLQIARFVLTTNMWALFVVLAYSGLRISEAAGLQWDDIDMKNRTIDVNKQIFGKSVLKYSFIPPKNEQSERIITFGDTVAKALQLLADWQKTERLSAKDPNPNDDFVFWCPTYPGYPVNISAVCKVMRKVLKEGKLPSNLTTHSLRHTHVSLLASNPRVTLPEIQARIGHKGNSKVTELVYLHVTKDRVQKLADDFEWAINN